MAAGELGQDPAGLGEANVGALADGEVSEGLRDVCLSDAGRYLGIKFLIRAIALVMTSKT
ncbi:hypothetical protein [Streptomyces hokutonensis]|uniref:hypothetical protein n=1 Tax=Streptomyces hokutonensis TaxID=1306990 RepID=UPI0036B80FC7